MALSCHPPSPFSPRLVSSSPGQQALASQPDLLGRVHGPSFDVSIAGHTRHGAEEGRNAPWRNERASGSSSSSSSSRGHTLGSVSFYIYPLQLYSKEYLEMARALYRSGLDCGVALVRCQQPIGWLPQICIFLTRTSDVEKSTSSPLTRAHACAHSTRPASHFVELWLNFAYSTQWLNYLFLLLFYL